MPEHKTLKEAHGKMEMILTEHEQHFSPEVRALFRVSLDGMAGAVKTAKVRETRQLVQKMNSREYQEFLSDPANKSVIDSL
jgi:hypothetical protein